MLHIKYIYSYSLSLEISDNEVAAVSIARENVRNIREKCAGIKTDLGNEKRKKEVEYDTCILT